jgi:hypothetical protein|tara:strand:+ start:320 stop:754 length:435 start_codon:yes stop_codon:yes gene_type:complete
MNYVSNCCGASSPNMDIDICPECKEHCEFVNEDPENNFNQLVVWPGTVMGDNTATDFEDFFKEEGFTVKFADSFMTLPDPGKDPSESGGRGDILFYIADEDIGKFSIWRLKHGMKWWEDYLNNGATSIVPVELLEKYKNAWEEA